MAHTRQVRLAAMHGTVFCFPVNYYIMACLLLIFGLHYIGGVEVFWDLYIISSMLIVIYIM